MPAERPRGEVRPRGSDSVQKALHALGATQSQGPTDGRAQFDANGQRVAVGGTHYEITTRGGNDGATFKMPWDLSEAAAAKLVAADLEYMQQRAKIVADLINKSSEPQREDGK